jgi:hypothetical protein
VHAGSYVVDLIWVFLGPVRERRELGGARRADAWREVKNG